MNHLKHSNIMYCSLLLLIPCNQSRCRISPPYFFLDLLFDLIWNEMKRSVKLRTLTYRNLSLFSLIQWRCLATDPVLYNILTGISAQYISLMNKGTVTALRSTVYSYSRGEVSKKFWTECQLDSRTQLLSWSYCLVWLVLRLVSSMTAKQQTSWVQGGGEDASCAVWMNVFECMLNWGIFSLDNLSCLGWNYWWMRLLTFETSKWLWLWLCPRKRISHINYSNLFEWWWPWFELQ